MVRGAAEAQGGESVIGVKTVGEVKLVGSQHTWALQERPGNVEHIWQEVLQVVRERVEPTKYTTWFAPLKPLSGAVGMLRLAVPKDRKSVV